jgi:hypothetical protein
MTSLITIVRKSEPYSCFFVNIKLSRTIEFLEAIRSVNPAARWKILVVDDFSQKLLGAVLKQFDILEENVTRA